MPPEELFSQFSLSEWWIYVLNLTPFASILSFTGICAMYMCGSGSVKLLNTDPIRIRINNTDTDKKAIDKKKILARCRILIILKKSNFNPGKTKDIQKHKNFLTCRQRRDPWACPASRRCARPDCRWSSGRPAWGRPAPGTCPRSTSRRGTRWSSRHTGYTRTVRPAATITTM